MLCLQVEVFKVSHRLFGGGRGSGLSVLTQGHPVCHGMKCHRLTFHSVPLTIASQTASWGVTGSTLPPATPYLNLNTAMVLSHWCFDPRLMARTCFSLRATNKVDKIGGLGAFSCRRERLCLCGRRFPGEKVRSRSAEMDKCSHDEYVSNFVKEHQSFWRLEFELGSTVKAVVASKVLWCVPFLFFILAMIHCY